MRGAWLLFLVLSMALAGATDLVARDAMETARARMVRQQLEARDITDPAVLAAMGKVPRHRFVPAAYAGQAYGDHPLPIGHGQTISQPYIVALMTQLVAPQPGQRALEIGTGSGYQAAVLAELGLQVFTLEIVPELARRSAVALRETGYESVATREGDGYWGWPQEAPFDVIMVTAAAERIPPPLLEQLKEGGRMIIPVGPPLGSQFLVLVRKEAGGHIRTETLLPVRFVPFTRKPGGE